MGPAGHRHRLLVYERVLNRWWPATLLLGLVLILLWWPVSKEAGTAQSWRAYGLLGIGGVVLLVSLLLFIFRKAAYVQAFPTFFRIVTPFLRLNISYKRVKNVHTVAMYTLFPPRQLRGTQRDIIEPLLAKTAIVIELNGYPVSSSVLRRFLSPFFFKDRTPHFVLLVRDWMAFSNEIETLRIGNDGQASRHPMDNSALYHPSRK
jgi:hypothetical protein